jgi:hypothetical protein
MVQPLNHSNTGQEKHTKGFDTPRGGARLVAPHIVDRLLRSLCEMPRNEQWRKVLAADLGLFNVAIFFFALLPPNTLVAPEWLIMVLALLSLTGVISHATRKINLPGENWAYLLTGATGLLTMFAYEIFAGSAAVQYRVTYGLFLLSGVVSAYAAHLIDGGKREGRG